MSTKFATSINLAQNSLLNAVIQNLSAAPGSPVNGQIYYDTTLNQFGVYCNGTWVYVVSVSNAVTMAAAASATGILLLSAGANRTAQAYSPASAGIVKVSSSGVASIAASGTDYAPATSGSGLLKGNGSGGFSAAVANTDYAPVASPTFTGTVTVPTPSTSTAAATKAYVDAAVQGVSAKYSAVAATTGSETYTISAGSVTQISGTTVDGVSPSVNDYILIASAPSASGTGTAWSSYQGSAQPGNGLYQVTGNTTNLTVSRAADFSGSNSPVGAYVFVGGGTANGKNGYIVVAPAPEASFTYGTNNVQFQQFTGAGELVQGTGISLSGNTVSIGATVPQRYTSGTLGNGSSTSITVTHSLGLASPYLCNVTVWDVSGGAGAAVMVICDVTAATANTVTLGFGSAPASNTIQCVVTG